MRVDDNLEIKQFAEKPKDPAIIDSLAISPALEARLTTPSTEKHCLASMGIYLFSRGVLKDALDNQMTDFGKEVIPSLLGKKRVCAYLFEGYWEDVGTIRTFFDANLALAQPLPQFNFYSHTTPIYTHARFLPATKINRCTIDHVVVGDGSIITDTTLKHCVIGIRAMVREGSHLEDVVMMGADFYESEEEAARKTPPAAALESASAKTARSAGRSSTRMRASAMAASCRPTASPTATIRTSVIICEGVLVVPKGAVIPAGTTI